MDTAITKGVKISVETTFRPDLSDISKRILFFNYAIEIENQNPFRVQLISRNWHIFDSLDNLRNVNGPGVIGEQPVLEPGEVFVYSSGCDLVSELGYMEGHYDFAQLNAEDKPERYFKVIVPRFRLEYPAKLN
ncbi:MAG: Co2+/Mg2+ efflux protein ApaG [Brumimicrobium sp.]|nr:Co2+/Mg2+ efflux protein ApaG [Brumimicrobium sp.]